MVVALAPRNVIAVEGEGSPPKLPVPPASLSMNARALLKLDPEIGSGTAAEASRPAIVECVHVLGVLQTLERQDEGDRGRRARKTPASKARPRAPPTITLVILMCALLSKMDVLPERRASRVPPMNRSGFHTPRALSKRCIVPLSSPARTLESRPLGEGRAKTRGRQAGFTNQFTALRSRGPSRSFPRRNSAVDRGTRSPYRSSDPSRA